MYMVTWHSRTLYTTPYVVDMKDIVIGRSYRSEMWETPPQQSDTTMFITNLVVWDLMEYQNSMLQHLMRLFVEFETKRKDFVEIDIRCPV